MNTIKKISILFINCMTLTLSFLIPKSKKIILVGGWFGNRFADNSKHFFLNLNDKKGALNISKVVWITRNDEILNDLISSGFNAYKAWSIRGMWYHFRAKYHVIDQTLVDINPFLSIRSKRINLWHGFPLKNIGIFMRRNNKRKPHYKSLKWYIEKFFTKGCWYDYFLLTTSDFSSKIIGEAFEIHKDRLIISGYPRNYQLITDRNIDFIPYYERKSYDKIDKYLKEDYKIIGYFPTFRDKRETLIFGTNDIDKLYKFLDFCESKKIKIVSKFHFAGRNDKIGEVKNHEAFINLSSDVDVYTFLNKIDILITDYSSIYFDFLLLNRPIIFFPYDLEYYRDEDRGFIFDYNELTPGIKVHTIEGLKALLLQDINSLKERYEMEYRGQADELKRKIFGDYYNMGIEHLLNQIRT